MADGGGAGQALDHFAAGEGVADEAEAAFGMEAAAVEGDDAGGFLAAMLEGVQPERRDGGGVGMAEDAEHAALFAQPVAIEVERRAHSVVRASIGGALIGSIVPAVPSISCRLAVPTGFAVDQLRSAPSRRPTVR